MAKTPTPVADAATERAPLDTDGPMLLGTTTGPGSASALLRLSGGRLKRVVPGDRVGLGRVAAIGAGQVILDQPGGQRRLTLPQG